MMEDLREQVEHFYDWEALGRGHLIWDRPVRIEPPFTSFKRISKITKPPIDDGRIETRFSSLFKNVLGAFRSSEPVEIDEYESEDSVAESLSPVLDDEASEVVELQVLLPEDTTVSTNLAEQFIASIEQCAHQVAFEVVATVECITVQFAAYPSDARIVRSQIESHFPEVTILEESGFLENAWNSSYDSLILELGLEREFMLPLNPVSSFKNDPLTGITGAISSLQLGEVAILQILFEPARHPWRSSIQTAITDSEGQPFFNDEPAFTGHAMMKLNKPLYAVVCRVGVAGMDYDRVLQIATHVTAPLSVLDSPGANGLVPLSNEEYDLENHRNDVFQRKSHRSGMIWNSAELVSLVHLPNTTVQHPKLKREGNKTKCAPGITSGHSIVLGENTHSDMTREVTLSEQHRLRHMHVIGTSGSGKSTLLFNLISQDIQQGHGCGILDPHGDLVDQILQVIPENRIKDVILFDPSDAEYPIGLNILNAHSELEKSLLASDLVSVFKRLSTSWGDQMTTVLRNAILAILESSTGGTLSDLRRFLVEPEFRAEFLKTVEDSQVVYFWKKEFPMLSGRPQAPLLTRLNTFLGPKTIRYMVSQRENKVNFGDIMDSGKIFLAKLSQGALGEENSYLLGSLLVAKFYQIAMSRQAMDATERRPYWLYIDEFHNFTSASMASILTGARKYGLGLCLAHQELKQIENRDANVAGSVVANPYVRVCFRLGDEDARKLQKGFSFFEAKDLQNLGVGEAICRIERSDYDFNLTVQSPQDDGGKGKDHEDLIRGSTRALYAIPRGEVEGQLRKEQEALLEEDETPQPELKSKHKESKTTPRTKQTEPKISDDSSSVPEEPSPKQNDQSVQTPQESSVKPTSIPSHEEIKEYLINAAEKLDYVVEREVWVLDGKGRVDLVFTRGDLKIACEIANTTTDEHEVGNIQKCLDAGFSKVVLVSVYEKRLNQISALFREKVSDTKQDVQFLSPDTFAEILQQYSKADPAGGRTEQTKPRKHKVDLMGTGQSAQELKSKEKDLIDLLKKNLRKS